MSLAAYFITAAGRAPRESDSARAGGGTLMRTQAAPALRCAEPPSPWLKPTFRARGRSHDEGDFHAAASGGDGLHARVDHGDNRHARLADALGPVAVGDLGADQGRLAVVGGAAANGAVRLAGRVLVLCAGKVRIGLLDEWGM